MRKRLRAYFSICLVIALSVVISPFGANAADPVTLTGVGPVWQAYELTSDGTPVTLIYDLKVDREPQTVGKWTYNADGSFKYGFQFTAYPDRTELNAHIEATDGVEYDVDQQGDDYDWSVKITTSLDLPGTPQDPKTYIALIFAGGVTSTPPTWTLTLPEAGTYLGDQTSGETFFLTQDHFDAPVNVSAAAAAPIPDPLVCYGCASGGRAIVAGRKVIDVEGVLLGEWRDAVRFPGVGAWKASAFQSTVTDQNGVQIDCTLGCGWHHYKAQAHGLFEGMPPGRYTFEQTGAGAAAASWAGPFLFGMDVTFPE